MYWWEIPWWQRTSHYAWWFWVDPHGEVRVTDPRFSQLYIYTRPSPAHEQVLTEAGWQRRGGNPDYYQTSDRSIALAALTRLGLPLPVWEGNYCYRVYWHEMTWHI